MGKADQIETSDIDREVEQKIARLQIFFQRGPVVARRQIAMYKMCAATLRHPAARLVRRQHYHLAIDIIDVIAQQREYRLSDTTTADHYDPP